MRTAIPCRDAGGWKSSGQFGPDRLPVIRSQLLASHSAGCGFFDPRTKFDRDGPQALFPLPNLGGRDAEIGGQLGLRPFF